MKEAELKRTVEDYLQIQMNMGKLYFDRLNSGDFIEVRGKTRRRIKGCRKGTADFFVLKVDRVMPIFLELKGEHGVVSEEQKEFAKQAIKHGADWFCIRGTDDLETALFGDIKDLWG